MSFEEVAALRKTDPEAAYAMAKDDLALQPNSPEARLALAWVLYDRLKHATDPEKLDDFVNILRELSNLELDEEGKMINNQAAARCYQNFRIHQSLESLFHHV